MRNQNLSETIRRHKRHGDGGGGGGARTPALLLCVLMLLLPILSGCAGSNAEEQFDVFPQNLETGRVATAGDVIAFSGLVSNTNLRTPRFVVVRPIVEPRFAAARRLVWNNDPAGRNVQHGRINSESGLYTAPLRLPDVTDAGAGEFVERVAVLDATTYNQITIDRTDEVLRVMAGVAPTDVAQIQSRFGQLGTDWGGEDRLYPVEAIQDILEANGLANANGTGGDLRAKLLLPTTNPRAAAIFTDSIGRTVAALPSARFTAIEYIIRHAVRAEPSSVDVSVRGSVRLSDLITLPGDQDLNLWDDALQTFTVRKLGDLGASEADNALRNGRVALRLDDPLAGAQGQLQTTAGSQNDFGTYIAPLTLRATGTTPATLITTGRASQDLIMIESRANTVRRPSARIQVQIVTSGGGGDGGAPVVIQPRSAKQEMLR